MGRESTSARILREDREKLNALRRELAAVQGKDICNHEVLRRVLNSDDIKKLLIQDAMIKRRLSK